MTEYIGIDMGGTNIRIGAIDENENLIYIHKEPTYKDVKTADDLYNKIKMLIKQVPNYEKSKAIGIGAPGSIDIKINKIVTSGNLGILKDYPLVDNLTNEFKKPVYIENDARVAAYAESLKGAGKDKKIVCYITISTGLGGGVVIDKNIYQGANNLGAYFSRMILDGQNTTDSLISGTALLKQAKQKINSNVKNTYELFELANNGNTIAQEIIQEFKKNLTIFLLNITLVINPDIIVLGGGVMNAKDSFLQDVIENLKIKTHPLAKNTLIETAFFDEPGTIGAALLAKKEALNYLAININM